MSELLRPNGDPLSLVAKSKLQEAGETPDPERLYVVQLLRWALSRGKVRPASWLPGLHRTMLDQMELRPPEEAFRWLVETEDGDREDQPSELARRSPREVAETLFDLLHQSMTATVPDYPLPRG